MSTTEDIDISTLPTARVRIVALGFVSDHFRWHCSACGKPNGGETRGDWLQEPHWCRECNLPHRLVIRGEA